MSYDLKAKVIIILSLIFFAGMIVFMWFVVRQSGDTAEMVNQKYDQLELIINWLEL